MRWRQDWRLAGQGGAGAFVIAAGTAWFCGASRAVCAQPEVSAQPITQPGTMLAGQLDLPRLVDLAAARLGLAIEYDEAVVKGTVTLRLPSALSDAELWDLTNRLLATRGLTTVRPPGSSALSVVRLADAAALAGVTLPEAAAGSGPGGPAPGGVPEPGGPAPGFVSVVLPVRHIPAKAAADAIAKVLSKGTGSATPLGDGAAPGAGAGGAAVGGVLGGGGAGGWLLVSDLAPRVEQARRLLALVDSPDAAAAVEEIALTHLTPEAMKALLDAVNGRTAGAAGAAIPGEVTPAPDGSSLLVAAPRGAMERWRALVERFDRPEPVRTFAYTPRAFAAAAVAPLLEQAARPLAPDDDRWRLAVEEATGSVVVTATPSQHEAIAALLERLDAAPAEDRRTVRWFPLRYREARDLEGVLMQLVGGGAAGDPLARGDPTSGLDLDPMGAERVGAAPEADARLLRQGVLADAGAQPGEAGGAPRFGEGEVLVPPALTLTTDEGTNTLIALGEPRLLEQVAELIARLDAPQPQVMLEVVMVSLSDSKARDLGVELSYLNISGDIRTRLSSLFGLGTRPGGAGEEEPGAGAGFTGVVLNPGDFSVVVRALETLQEGRSLTRPRLLVGNNEQATLNSVQEQPFATTSSGDTSTITSFGGTLQAGTQVSITPRISGGGNLTLEYSVSLSSFTGTATATLPPPRQQNSVQSMARLPDGHTVVVGGIELETDADSESRVPFIGAIPVIGEAFKSRSRSAGRARFYVFIRADILRARGFEDLKHISSTAREGAGVPEGWPELRPRVIR